MKIPLISHGGQERGAGATHTIFFSFPFFLFESQRGRRGLNSLDGTITRPFFKKEKTWSDTQTHSQIQLSVIILCAMLLLRLGATFSSLPAFTQEQEETKAHHQHFSLPFPFQGQENIKPKKMEPKRGIRRVREGIDRFLWHDEGKERERASLSVSVCEFVSFAAPDAFIFSPFHTFPLSHS